MKVYVCSYEKILSRGGYEIVNAVAVANTESEALGFLLGNYPKTEARCWDIEEIDTGTSGTIYISSAES